MPSLFILEERYAPPLHRLGDNERGLVALLLRLLISASYLLNIVAVYLNGVPAETTGTGGISAAVPFKLGWAALAEPVHVENAHQIVQLVVAGMVESLPYRAFGHL